MIAAVNKNKQEAGETLFALNANDHIRDLCEAREDYRRIWDSVKLDMEEKDSRIRERDTVIASLEAQVAELQQKLQNSMN